MSSYQYQERKSAPRIRAKTQEPLLLATPIRAPYRKDQTGVASGLGLPGQPGMRCAVGHCTLRYDPRRAEAQNHAEMLYGQGAQRRSHVRSTPPAHMGARQSILPIRRNPRIPTKNDPVSRERPSPMCSPSRARPKRRHGTWRSHKRDGRGIERADAGAVSAGASVNRAVQGRRAGRRPDSRRRGTDLAAGLSRSRGRRGPPRPGGAGSPRSRGRRAS